MDKKKILIALIVGVAIICGMAIVYMTDREQNDIMSGMYAVDRIAHYTATTYCHADEQSDGSVWLLLATVDHEDVASGALVMSTALVIIPDPDPARACELTFDGWSPLPAQVQGKMPYTLYRYYSRGGGTPS